jgi:membrane protein required for colicin V production
MNLIDVFIGVILLLGFYSGFKRGLIVELTSLLGLILGIFGAYYISKHYGLYIGQWLDWDAEYLRITTFLVSFILIIIVVSLIGKLMTKLLDVVALGTINKILGGVFGLLKFALLISVLLLLFNIINNEMKLVQQKTLDESLTYPILNGLSETVWGKMVDMSQEHKEVIDQLPSINEK